MVSFWPFKGEDNSPASFEKTLSSLSTRIAKTANRLDAHRQQARRFKALWTLYTTFAYLFYSIILALVLGWHNWGVVEYAAVLGGPVIIYAVRVGADKFFEYRISRTQHHLDELHSQREQTIERLKIATKYNSTQQLLEKYGGEKPAPPKGAEGPEQRGDAAGPGGPPPPPPPGRTGLPPPPTANIRRPQTPQQPPQHDLMPPSPGLPPRPPSSGSQPPYPMQDQFPSAPPSLNEPVFAPNAFPSAAQYYDDQPRWYDRILDVLLGEDETHPKNRLALICRTCRLVNGQAPPGMKDLSELGRWRCGGCGAWNGEESEAKKVLADIRSQSQSQSSTDGAWEPVSRGDGDVSSGGEGTDEGVMVGEDDRGSTGESQEGQSEGESNRGRGSRRGG